MAKKIQTPIAPAPAPNSGRTSRRRTRLVFATRSSASGAGRTSAACVTSMALPPLKRPTPGYQPPVRLASSRRRKFNDLCRVLLRDKARTGHQDRVGDGVEVRGIERQQHNWQVALHVLLGINGEEHIATLDCLEHVRREVKGGELDGPQLTDPAKRLEGGRGPSRTEGEDAVDIWICGERGLDP